MYNVDIDPVDRDLFGVYIHWPYCSSKCPYCDFNSYVSDMVDHASWRDAYMSELEYYSSVTDAGKVVTSVFFGGGTPSLMEPQTVETVLSTISKFWDVSDDLEVTLEANPTSVEAGKFRSFRNAGINRVSLGVQSLNNDDLAFLGRKHSADEAIKAIEIAAAIFDKYSFDLIYALPDQSPQFWEEELKEAIKLSAGHMSLYQLTIERGTPFYMQHKRGEFSVANDHIAADMFNITQQIMEEAGMAAYEVSNHASKGQESLHNLSYWRYHDYIGVGPGAHGRITRGNKRKATRGHKVPDIWLKRVVEKGCGSHEFEDINEEQRFIEALMMGLRLTEGIPVSRIEKQSGISLYDFLDRYKLQSLKDQGLISSANDNVIQATREGILRLNAILGYLL
jgi:oxygen-independent coproporphyrinogen-3 oxidase